MKVIAQEFDKGKIVYWHWVSEKLLAMGKFREPTAQGKEIHQRALILEMKKILEYVPSYF
jgi:hypothetical protein